MWRTFTLTGWLGVGIGLATLAVLAALAVLS